jgi:predicted transcriptional regulator
MSFEQDIPNHIKTLEKLNANLMCQHTDVQAEINDLESRLDDLYDKRDTDPEYLGLMERVAENNNTILRLRGWAAMHNIEIEEGISHDRVS